MLTKRAGKIDIMFLGNMCSMIAEGHVRPRGPPCDKIKGVYTQGGKECG